MLGNTRPACISSTALWSDCVAEVLRPPTPVGDVVGDMAALRAEERRLLAHCHGGASRSSLVLRAWLMRTEGMTADEATAHVAAHWPHLGLWNASSTAALDRRSR